jgi:hypothetical protein
MASILVLVGQKPPKRDEHEKVDDDDQVFHSFGQGVEFMKNVRHSFLLCPGNAEPETTWFPEPVE